MLEPSDVDKLRQMASELAATEFGKPPDLESLSSRSISAIAEQTAILRRIEAKIQSMDERSAARATFFSRTLPAEIFLAFVVWLGIHYWSPIIGYVKRPEFQKLTPILLIIFLACVVYAIGAVMYGRDWWKIFRAAHRSKSAN